MCWIGTSSAKIAEKDIVVYKIGKVLNNKFRSLYQNYFYGAKELNTKISLRPASGLSTSFSNLGRLPFL